MAVPVTVIVAPGPPPSFDLHGPLTPRTLEAALAALPPCAPTLQRHTETHHTLHLPPPPFPAGTLADLLAAPQGHALTRPQPRRSGAGRAAYAADGDPAAPVGSAEPVRPAAPAGPAVPEPLRGASGRSGPAGAAAAVRGPGSDPRSDAGRPPADLTGTGTGPGTGTGTGTGSGTGSGAWPGPDGSVVPAAPLQRDVLLDALARPDSGLHIGQVYWRWHGPLDTERFAAAWQSLADREAVLRAALARPVPDAGPQIAVHRSATVEVRRHRHDTADWYALLAAERTRPFDLRRPGPLRIALLDEPPAGDGTTATTRVLVTYHQALLDGRSVRILLGAFYRAYLADGRVPGGRRRPDLRDHLDWLHARDLRPARAFWSQAVPPQGAATLPARPAARTTGRLGHGRIRHTLTPVEAVRLRDWAALWGATESTAVHAAWALQLYRPVAGPDAGPRSVAFAVTVTGRGIALDGVEGLPAPLRNPLPVHVVVDPAATVPGLLAELTGRALEAAAYEWVSAGQIRAWSGAGPQGTPPPESLIVFEPPRHTGGGRPGPGAHPEEAYREELAAEDVRVDPPEAVTALTGVPFTLTAHHEADGSLVLAAVHDRTRLSDDTAELILTQTAGLLRELPYAADGSTTVAEALGLLSGSRVPLAAARRGRGPLRLLRPAAHPGAGTVLLVPPPEASEDCYDGLAGLHTGPQALATLAGPADAADFLAALRPALEAGEPLVLGGFSGAGVLACEIAERIAAHGWYPPLVAVAGAADGRPESVSALNRALSSATAGPG
ncbi:condensation domain-containing protein [Streptomyces sp. NPDC101206]|uniref:condensation domain-containing protein n=1 Tax=Streptomyces sp. NPDC101206 TaxID=3366128 RepID=UPI00382D0721